MQLTGTIIQLGSTQTFGSNGFRKREVVIQTEEQYPQSVLVEFIQDKCDVLDKYALGNKVTIDINIRGREWVNPQGEAKYFNTIQGWRINKNEEEIHANEASSNVNQMTVTDPQTVEADDDLPF